MEKYPNSDRVFRSHEDSDPKWVELGHRGSSERRVGNRALNANMEKNNSTREKAKKVLKSIAIAAAFTVGLGLAGRFDAEANAPFTEKDHVEETDNKIKESQTQDAIELPEDDSNIEIDVDTIIPPVPVSPSPNNTEQNSNETPQE